MVYDWLIALGGGEKVVEAIDEIYPTTIYTLLADKKVLAKTSLSPDKVRTSFLQKLLFRYKKHGKLLPLFPLAVEQFDLRSYDCVLSVSHCCAKGALTLPGQMHICYCFTPMRYAWDLYHDYIHDYLSKKPIRRFFAMLILHYLRTWDYSASSRVDHFIAISNYVAKRIEKTYQRKAVVIYPPVDTQYFTYEPEKQDYYVSASRFVPYKKMDVIAEAFRHLPHARLILIGEGPERKKVLRKKLPNVSLVGWVDRLKLRTYLQKAKGFIFAALEDFGIAPVEAMSTGTPVIAYGKGGARETVVEGKTGIFFGEQTPESIQKAVQRFETCSFDYQTVHQHAQKFSKERFQKEFAKQIDTYKNAFSSS